MHARAVPTRDAYAASGKVCTGRLQLTEGKKGPEACGLAMSASGLAREEYRAAPE